MGVSGFIRFSFGQGGVEPQEGSLEGVGVRAALGRFLYLFLWENRALT